MSQPLVRDYYALSYTSGGYQRSNLLGGFLYLSGYLRTQGCLVSLVALACTTGDDGVRCTGDDGVRCTGDDGVRCTGDDGVLSSLRFSTGIGDFCVVSPVSAMIGR